MTTTFHDPISPTRASPGRRLLDGLSARDFAAVEQLLTADVWLRALLPRHLDEHFGPAETTAAFRTWYGDATAFEVVALDHHAVAGKQRVSYRFRLRPDWAPETWHLIEQVAFLSVHDGLIRKIDLVCTGFMPESGSGPSGRAQGVE
jgi:hypothetical protein